MSSYARKTVAVNPAKGNDLGLVQSTPPMRNSMRDYNQIVMKTYEQMLPFFSTESGLEYVDQFVYSNNSVYRGQMKKVDESMRLRMQSSGDATSSANSMKGGALQNRLSAKCDSMKDIQGPTSNEYMDEGRQKNSEKSETPTIVRHGYGVQYWTDGAHYEGQWTFNKAEGQGTFWHAEGDVYRGEFKNDMANGYGDYTHINGSKYKGEFRDDVQEGHGEEEWIDGAKYIGSYKNGMKDGYGVYKWSNGSVYKGNWVINKICGYGEYTWNDQRTYQGYWLDNNMHGQGIYKWADGRKYEGDYLNDKKHGYGIYTYPDGRSYKGQWANGKQHGEGIFITPQGEQRRGIWNEGKRIKWVEEDDQQYMQPHQSHN